MQNQHLLDHPDTPSKKFILKRDDFENVINITCDDIPGMYLSMVGESVVPEAIRDALKGEFQAAGKEVSVYINGSTAGPQINTRVELK